MLKLTPPRIDTGIGVGAAQVFGRTNPDLSAIGFADGYNSEEAQNARNKKKADETVGKLGHSVEGMTLPYAQKINTEYQSAREGVEQAFMPNGGGEIEANRIINDFKYKHDLAVNASKLSNTTKSTYAKEDPMELKGAEFYTGLDNPETYFNEDGEYRDIEEMAAITAANADQIGLRYDQMPETKPYATQVIGNTTKNDNGSFGVKKRVLTDAGKKQLETDVNTFALSAMNSLRGTTPNPVRENYNWGKKMEEEFYREKKNEISALGGDKEAIDAMLLDYFKEKRTQEHLDASKVGEDIDNEFDNTTKEEKEKKEDEFDNDLYQITNEKQTNVSTVPHTGEDKALGEEKYVVSNTPEVNMVIDVNGEKAEGKSFKIRYDFNGDKKVYVKVAAKSSDEGNLKSTVVEKVVDYEKIKGQLNKKELEFFDRHFELMKEKQGSLRGFTQDESDSFTKGIEEIRAGVRNNTDEVKSFVNDFFGSDVVSAYDPSSDSDDITIEIKENGKVSKKTFNLDDKKGIDEFTDFALDYRMKQQRQSASTGGAY